MRLTKFIGQNKEKWIEFEENFKLKRTDPDKLSKLFIQITDDLSYARAFYPNRSIKVYLNGLAQQVSLSLYKNRKTSFKRLRTFWTDELPQIIYQSRRVFLLSFVIFWASFAIGVLSCKYDHEFPELIFGSDYVNTTNENIKNGDPLGIYKNSDQSTMFLQIAWNNLRVDVYTFVGGLMASLGALLIMVYNGIMVGTFQYYFIQRGLFADSFLTIWIHGTLEISTIIISAAAGMILGSGLVFPGTYSRMQAFRLSARKGIKIMIGMAPITVAAAFLEGFVTRYTDAPTFVRLGIIVLSLFFILAYYVYYPWRLSRKGFQHPLEEEDLPPQREYAIKLDVIRETGDVFTDLFGLYKVYLQKIFFWGLGFSIVFTAAFFMIMGKKHGIWVSDDILALIIPSIVNQFAVYFNSGANFRIWGFDFAMFYFINVLTLTTFRAYILSQRKADKPLYSVFKLVMKKHWFNLLIINMVIASCFLLGVKGFLLAIVLYPLMVIWQISLVAEDGKFFASLKRGLVAFKGSWLTYVLLFLVSMLFLLVLTSPPAWIFFELVEINYKFNTESYNTFYLLYFTFMSVMAMMLILPVSIYGLCLAYASHIEINEAHGLMDRVMAIGTKRKLYGLEQEA